MRRRPRIRLRTPSSVLPGSPFEATVALDIPRELAIDGVSARLTGTERTTVGSGKGARTQRMNLFLQERTLAGTTTLAPGIRLFRTRFDLPANLPPSYSSRKTCVEYEIRVHVDIPWWPDARGRFALNVGHPPQGPEPPGVAVLVAFPPGGPQGDEAAFEGSLAGTVLAQGGTVRGAVALLNVERRRYRGFSVTLVGVEHRVVTSWPGVRKETSVVERHGGYFPTPSPVEGEPVEFAVAVPTTATPTIASHMWRLEWFAEIELDISWALNPKLRTPVTLVAAAEQGEPRPAPAPPSVGSPRLAKLWQSAAEEIDMSYDAGALRARIGDVELDVTREHRGRRGTHLVARLSYAPLDLGLHTHGGDIRGRDAAQVRSFLAMLGRRLAQNVVSMTDEETRIELKDSGQHRERLILFTTEAAALGAALAQIRPDLPIPTPEATRLPAWQELARRLEGPLQRGRLAVSGRFRGMSADVEMRWGGDGAPLGARVTLRPPVKLGNPARSEVEGGGELTVTDDSLTLDLPPPSDPLTLLDHLAKLHELAERLAPAGPYR